MKFQKISDKDSVTDYLVETLSQRLDSNERVLWLVPGGSAIAIAAAVSRKLSNENCHNLTVTLTDERFGPVGHSDSNMLQLRKAGFDLPEANIIEVLIGKSRAATTERFTEELRSLLEQSDYRLGFFGIGPDGHTAGILPGSVAVTSKIYAADYDDGTYERITITPAFIAKLDEAVVYAVGQEKQLVFDELESDKPISEQPAQALKSIDKLTIFNDYKGETV